jgi:hypothetical protein
MAAAGGNNWQWSAVRLYNPDFTLDAAFKAFLDAGRLSSQLQDAFARQGLPLSSTATVNVAPPEFDGLAWHIQDGILKHVVRQLLWFNNGLNVYSGRSTLGFEELPDGVKMGLTMRRCVRVGKSEGRLLEDLGVQPDIIYDMTLNDVLYQNKDLLNRATLELSQMKAYDLRVDSVLKDEGCLLTFHTKGLSLLQCFIGQQHFASFEVSDSTFAEVFVPSYVHRLAGMGFDGGKLVARTIVVTQKRDQN